MARPKNFALIVAGGAGSRMQVETPKQFLSLGDKPVLFHSIETFADCGLVSEIVLVLPENQAEHWSHLTKKHHLEIEVLLVNGGKTRFHSVKNGLKSLPENGLVAIHDGVRPLVSSRLIHDCFEAAEKHGAAIPVVGVKDSTRAISGEKSRPLNRANLRAVQTPQCFHLKQIQQAYNQTYDSKFTDDASVFEADGGEVFLVEGEEENLKITLPLDLQLAELILGKRI